MPYTGVDFTEFSTDKLLDAIIQLTHRIHGTEDSARADSLRAQRDMVRAEVLRRTGE